MQLPSTELDDNEDATSNEFKARLISAHVLKNRTAGDGPTFVAMQGPQGCGKSTVMSAVQRLLSSDPYNLAVCVASLDDFYLTHDGLVELARSNPENGLWKGRGQPGTHDLALLHSLLNSISKRTAPIHLPIFDKSLYDGEGDRSTTTLDVAKPLDVFILEGWSMGFVPREDLENHYKLASTESAETPPHFLSHSFSSLAACDRSLRAMSETIYPFFSTLIQVKPQTYSFVYDWRLQQEHHMKRINGGRGMTDEQVKAFVDRYMPGYELWEEELRLQPHWEGRSLGLSYGPNREIIRIDEF